MVVKTTKIPFPGEAVTGGEYGMNPGWKGANQAVAVARWGGNAIFISKIGNAVFGRKLIELIKEERIIISGCSGIIK